jgi:hypothetical protein
MTDLLHRNDRFFTVDNKNLKISVCAKVACCLCELIFTFIYAGSSIQYATEQFASCAPLSFVNFALHPIPQTNI